MHYNIRTINKNDYNKQYFKLLEQLTTVDKHKIKKLIFDNFINKLNNNHMIYVIEDLEKKNNNWYNYFIKRTKNNP